eukprot:TRINITY_DN8739_c1_g2_i1.p1 TRINITY_DN8739_c1_g2~~TRINITY_DN8739_c1_g2_i1.p1  ORF type:complete len:498 (+),score=91.06 TRINITY_DN8739_c1_g2_i1:74-1567(+)
MRAPQRHRDDWGGGGGGWGRDDHQPVHGSYVNSIRAAPPPPPRLGRPGDGRRLEPQPQYGSRRPPTERSQSAPCGAGRYGSGRIPLGSPDERDHGDPYAYEDEDDSEAELDERVGGGGYRHSGPRHSAPVSAPSGAGRHGALPHGPPPPLPGGRSYPPGGARRPERSPPGRARMIGDRLGGAIRHAARGVPSAMPRVAARAEGTTQRRLALCCAAAFLLLAAALGGGAVARGKHHEILRAIQRPRADGGGVPASGAAAAGAVNVATFREGDRVTATVPISKGGEVLVQPGWVGEVQWTDGLGRVSVQFSDDRLKRVITISTDPSALALAPPAPPTPRPTAAPPPAVPAKAALFQVGDSVAIDHENVVGGSIPQGATGTVIEVLKSGKFRVRMDPIKGIKGTVKIDVPPEHIRRSDRVAPHTFAAGGAGRSYSPGDDVVTVESIAPPNGGSVLPQGTAGTVVKALNQPGRYTVVFTMPGGGAQTVDLDALQLAPHGQR